MRSFRHRQKIVIVAVIASAVGHCANTARAVVIDDFSVGPIIVVGPDLQTQTGLDPAHVLGGSRTMNVGKFGSGSVLEINPADGAEFSSSGRGYLTLQYDFTSLGGVDFSQGDQDRFRLQFGEIETSGFTPFALYITLPPNSSDHGVSSSVGDWDAVILEFPFDSFPVSMSDAQNMTLDVLRNPAGASLTLKSVITAGPPVVGDYSRDNVVDSEDYTTWRRFFGISTKSGSIFPLASADGNGDGRVDAADYVVWRNSRDSMSPEGLAASSTVPEPVTVFRDCPVLIGWLLCYGRRWPLGSE